MALIDCPSCGKKISDKAQSCQYWGGVTQEDLQFKLAFAVAVIGFVWYIVNRVRLVFLKKSD